MLFFSCAGNFAKVAIFSVLTVARTIYLSRIITREIHFYHFFSHIKFRNGQLLQDDDGQIVSQIHAKYFEELGHIIESMELDCGSQHQQHKVAFHEMNTEVSKWVYEGFKFI